MSVWRGSVKKLTQSDPEAIVTTCPCYKTLSPSRRYCPVLALGLWE